MKAICKKLKSDIQKSAYKKFNPYSHSFKPGDLDLISSNYGSFSDHCKKGSTKSSKWCGCGQLILVQKKPFKYILKK